MGRHYGECVNAVIGALRLLVQVGEEFEAIDVRHLLPELEPDEASKALAAIAQRTSADACLVRVSRGRYQLIAAPRELREGKQQETTIVRGHCGCGMQLTTSGTCPMDCED